MNNSQYQKCAKCLEVPNNLVAMVCTHNLCLSCTTKKLRSNSYNTYVL